MSLALALLAALALGPAEAMARGGGGGGGHGGGGGFGGGGGRSFGGGGFSSARSFGGGGVSSGRSFGGSNWGGHSYGGWSGNVGHAHGGNFATGRSFNGGLNSFSRGSNFGRSFNSGAYHPLSGNIAAANRFGHDFGGRYGHDFGRYGHGRYGYGRYGWGLGYGLGFWGPWWGWGLGYDWGYPWWSDYGYLGYYGYPGYQVAYPGYVDGGGIAAPVADSSSYDTGATAADTAEASDYYAQAIEAFQAGNYPEAMRLAGHAGIDNPRDPNVHLLLSLAMFEQGNYVGAAAEAHAVAALGAPVNWTSLIGFYNNGVEAYTTKLRDLESYVTKNPTQAPARFLLGFQYLAMGHKDAARMELEEVVRTVPRDPIAGELLTQAGGHPPQNVAERPKAAQPPAPIK
jgi:tetratricopeptide (TPR) repeat protein